MNNEQTFQRAVKWAYTMNWGEKGFSALFAFVLASILGPRNFGTVAMAMVYVSFIQMFLDQGLLTALIQRKDLQREHLDAVFWMDLVASLLLVAVTVALSKWWAAINHLPELALVIVALSIMVPIEGLSIVQRAVLQREMDFRSLSLRSNVSVVIGGAVGLTMAFKGFGVWALVGQRISQDVSALALLWSLSHWRPRWRFSPKHLKDLLGFSTASFTAKLAVFGNQQSDAFLMGIFFGPVAVGLYRLADRLMTLVLDGATNSLQVVSLSQFSKVQDNPSELRQSALSCIRISATLTLPALAGLAVVSNPLMAAIGPKWAPAADVLKILCALGMALVFLNFTGPLVTALSRPRFMAVLEWVRTATGIAVLMVVSLLLRDATVRGQVVGVAVLRLVVGGMIFTPIFLFVLMRFCRITLKELVAVITPSACAAAATAAVLMALSLSGLLRGFKPIVLLAAETTVGGLVAGAILLALDRQLRAFVLGLMSKVRRHDRSRGAGEVPYKPLVDPLDPEDSAIALSSSCHEQECDQGPNRSRQIKTLKDVVDWDLCTGCGACYYACKKGAVTLVNIENVGIRPTFSTAQCASCTDCLSICPGYTVDGDLETGGLPKQTEADHEFGPSLEIWEGFASDPDLRFRASSGGILSALALYCLERENMGFVLHAAMDEEKPWTNKTVQSRTRSEILARTGSRYAPASPCDGLREIQQSDRPCVFIGKPCDVAAVAMSRKQRPELDRKLGLVLTFFCAGTPSTQGTLDLLKLLNVPPDKVNELRYRGEGWPGSFKVLYDGRTQEKSYSYTESWGKLADYRPQRCHLCPDGLGRLGDISCGDSWEKFNGGADNGRSIVIVRTRRGQELLHRALAAGYLDISPVGQEAVLAAQPNLLARRKEIFGRFLARRVLLIPTPKFSGFSLFRSWIRLPFVKKMRTVVGTVTRALQRGQWRRHPLFQRIY